MGNTAVVILNYNGVDYLRRFLPSVTEYSGDCQIVVIDNNSSDSSLDFLNNHYPGLQVIPLKRNFGFSGGYNQGLIQVEADNYILLNSDVEVTPGWADSLLRYMDTHPEVAIGQPKLLSHNHPDQFDYAGAAGGFLDVLGYPFCRGRVFNHLEKDRGQYDNDQLIFWAGGACFFIRARIFREMGGFDEDFFAHMEEIDLCWRCHRAGYKTAYVSRSKVYHLGGGTLKETNPYKTYLNFRNGLQLLVKNSSVSQLIWKIPVRIVLDLIACLRFLLKGSIKHFAAVLKAEWFFLIRLPVTWAKRSQCNAPFKSKLCKTLIVWDYFIGGKKTFQAIAAPLNTR